MSMSVAGRLAAVMIFSGIIPVFADENKQDAEPPADCNTSQGDNCTPPRAVIRSGQIGLPASPAPISPSGRAVDADMSITAPDLKVEQIFPGRQVRSLSMERE